MSRSPTANHARSYDNPSTTSTEYSRQPKAARGSATKRCFAQNTSTKVASLVDLHSHGRDRWLAVPFCSQITIKPRLDRFLAILASAAVLIAALCAPCLAGDQPTNITIVSGPQLKERLGEERKTENGNIAIRYFEDSGDKVYVDGLTAVQFQLSNQDYSVFFIPFQAAATSKEGQPAEHPVVLAAKGPKGSKAHLGTVISRPKEPLEVKDEKVVVNGKIEPSKGEMIKFLRCTIKDCLGSSISCLAVGEGWPLCLCLGCGAGVVTCGLTELFYPQ
jgi:hypothetical protein